jgi:hypothetical protein
LLRHLPHHGINIEEQPAFDAAEQACVSSYPDCGCGAGPYQLDDGTTFGPDAAFTATVSCQAGQCLSSARFE